LRMNGYFDIVTSQAGGTTLRLFIPVGKEKEELDAVA